MEGDYDGDMMNIRGIWTDEANLEAEEIMQRKMTALNITGANSRVVSKEIFNSYYELTKIGSNPKQVSQQDKEKYLQMKPDDFTLSFITKMISNTADISTGKLINHKAKHNTWDTILVPANYFYENQSETKTTIGRFLVNKYLLEGSNIINVSGYIDTVLNKSGLGDLDSKVGIWLLEDLINREQFNAYINRRDNLGYWVNGMLAHTISERMSKPLPALEKYKQELYKKYEKELKSGNIDVMTKVSDELVEYAKALLKDDPGMDLYDSGDLDFGNNYKNNSILKGAVMNQLTKEFDFIDTSFMDGIKIKDIPAHANSILSGQYPASIATKDAGYTGKKLLALLQMMEVDEHGTDCGTKNPIPLTITKNNKNDVVYTYIDVDGQLQLITPENVNSYVGKTVMARSPMSCISHKICSKCAGELFYKLGVKQIGLSATALSHSMLNLGLKSKHISNIYLYQIDPDTIIEDV